jgi:hypothetical protein
MAMYAYNPNYGGGRDRRIMVWGSPDKSKTLAEKWTREKKGSSSKAVGGPKFKPQHHKKKKTRIICLLIS